MSCINTDTAAYDVDRNLRVPGMNLEESIQKLAPGFRIRRAAEDAAGRALATGLRATGTAVNPPAPPGLIAATR